MKTLRYWGLTDPGCVRAQNQDVFVIQKLRRGGMLFVVCDGMGGAKSGNVASSLAAEVFTHELQHSYRGQTDREQLEQILDKAVTMANYMVYEQAHRNPEYEGMGTTLTAVLIKGKQAVVVNVGDSRVYHLSDSIRQITEDHSLVQMMLRKGELTKEQAQHFPGRNYITRAIGTDPAVQCDTFHLDLKKGEYLLLCSDGLTNMVDEQEILFEVTYGDKAEHCCHRLRDITIDRGAPDNVTSVLVQV